MLIKTICKATAVGMCLAAAGHADPLYISHGIAERWVDRVVDHRVVFETLHARGVRFAGNPYFDRGHYVVHALDRFRRPALVEVNPYTGAYIGFVRP